jgi:hypothetical protein
VIRRSKHASADELARLEADDLRPRRAARIARHLTGCDQCTELIRQLSNVPAILSSASTYYRPMPEIVYTRIEAVLAVESRARLAAQPATEAGRGELPARHRRRTSRPGWHLPGLSVPATRLVAAAGALVIAAGGSYAIASRAGNGASSAQSAGSAAAPAQVQQMSLGPNVTYGRPGALHTIQSVQSSAEFAPASLRTQAVSAVHAAEARGASGAQPSFSAPAPSRAQASNSIGSGTAAAGPVAQLAGCLNLIAAARTVLLVDMALYEHKPATIIVLAATGSSPAEAWVVGASCSAKGTDVLAHAVLGHI